MPMMNIRHMSVLVLGEGMLVFVGMRLSILAVPVKIIVVTVDMLVDDRHMDMKMGVLFICQ